MCKVLPRFTCKVLLYNFNFIIKFLLLFLNFEVVVGIGLLTGLLICQLTIVVRIAHIIIRFRNVFLYFTVVIL